MIDENVIRTRYAAIKDQLDERGRRLFVAAEKAAAAGPVTRNRGGRPGDQGIRTYLELLARHAPICKLGHIGQNDPLTSRGFL